MYNKLCYTLHLQVCSEQILSIAVDKMASDQGLWEHYFTDFITHKLKLVGPDPYPNLYNDTQDDDIAQKVWHTYFEQLHKREMPQRLVELHCYANIYHVYLAKMAIILHPLEKIERVCPKPQIIVVAMYVFTLSAHLCPCVCVPAWL